VPLQWNEPSFLTGYSSASSHTDYIIIAILQQVFTATEYQLSF